MLWHIPITRAKVQLSLWFDNRIVGLFPCLVVDVPRLYHDSIFNKLIDEHGHLDMRNVTTLIWVNRKRFDIVETIVELLIEVRMCPLYIHALCCS